ncbi:hypothetical protein [Amycolatopsis taiwanensis]|uniref:hypothetical protein n=1 Tax=Amycolatopsis taiwanensis TaxID=342230 RepID=UPI0025521241|nr:hypothetical protein [Amycolatopsis taiwanensis]
MLDHAPRNLTALERYLLVILAEYTKDIQGRECERSTQDLAWRMGLSTSRVSHILADLAEHGVEVRVPLKKDGRDHVDKRGRLVYTARGKVPRYRLPRFSPPAGCPCLACYEAREGSSIQRPSERSSDAATLDKRSLESADKVAGSSAEGRYIRPERSPDLATPNVPGIPVTRSPRAHASDAARLAEEASASEDEINTLVEKITAERPDVASPVAWLRACHKRGDLAEMLAEVRTEYQRARVAGELERARLDRRMECEHGTPGGLYRRPDTGRSATCAQCRATQRTEVPTDAA